MAIFVTMQFIKPDVQTVCCGIAMSIAAVIQAGGARGKRTILPHSRMLIHQPSGGFQGQSTDIGIHAREALALRDLIEQRLAIDTGQTRERIHEDSERDRFFTPEESVAYGLVDRVVPGRS
jgi:ATP-dependent Clp protease protease subunit